MSGPSLAICNAALVDEQHSELDPASRKGLFHSWKTSAADRFIIACSPGLDDSASADDGGGCGGDGAAGAIASADDGRGCGGDGAAAVIASADDGWTF